MTRMRAIAFTIMAVASSLLRKTRWYAARLAAMPPREIPHRILEMGRKRRWRRNDRRWGTFEFVDDGPLADLTPLRERMRRREVPQQVAQALRDAFAGEIRLLGLNWPPLPPLPTWRERLMPELWRHDPVAGRTWPGAETSAFDVDVRSSGSRIGDVKYVWELNRLQLLHPLAIAIARSQEPGLRDAALAVLSSWAAANPPYRGVNWTSGIEVSMRLVSMLLIIAAIEPQTVSASDRILLRRLVAAHGRWLHAFPSLYSSANNHRVAEGLGLMIAGLLVADLPEALVWRVEGRRVLETEARRQIPAGGVGVEQSPTYQAFVMEMLALAVRIADDAGDPLAPSVLEALNDGAAFLRWLLDDEGRAPMIGDDDEGRVLAQPPDREPRYVASIVAAVAGLTGQEQMAPPARDPHLRDLIFDSPATSGERQAGLKIFDAGGYTCAKETINGRRSHLVFDHGPLGFAPLSAHGHADALAIWLTIDDQPVFIDAGTYLYFSGRATRTRLRESLAHNTLAVAGRSQSQARPAFSWATQARARLVTVERGASWAVRAVHDGYRRSFGVQHERRIQRLPSGYTISDSLDGTRNALPVTLSFLCHPDLEIRATSGRSLELSAHGRSLCFLTPPAGFAVHVVRGEGNREGRAAPDGLAQVSPAFGEITPTAQLVLSGTLASEPVTTEITIAALPGDSSRAVSDGQEDSETARVERRSGERRQGQRRARGADQAFASAPTEQPQEA